MIETEQYRFTKDDTKLMKGFAILLMLAHHLWGFPDRLVSELPMTSMTARGMEFAGYIGGYGKICVSLFMFLGGLGTYIWYEQKNPDWFGKIRKLYLSYWKVFFIFVPIGFLLKMIRGVPPDYCVDTAVCHVFDEFHLSEFFANLIGLSCQYNREWWFFSSYLVVLATFPVVYKVIGKHSFGINLWIVCIYQVLAAQVFPALASEQYFPALGESWLYRVLICQNTPWAACFWCGCVFAKDHMLERLRKYLDASGCGGCGIYGDFYAAAVCGWSGAGPFLCASAMYLRNCAGGQGPYFAEMFAGAGKAEYEYVVAAFFFDLLFL